MRVDFPGNDVNSFQSRVKESLAGVADRQTFCDLQNDKLFRYADFSTKLSVYVLILTAAYSISLYATFECIGAVDWKTGEILGL